MTPFLLQHHRRLLLEIVDANARLHLQAAQKKPAVVLQ